MTANTAKDLLCSLDIGSKIIVDYFAIESNNLEKENNIATHASYIVPKILDIISEHHYKCFNRGQCDICDYIFYLSFNIINHIDEVEDNKYDCAIN